MNKKVYILGTAYQPPPIEYGVDVWVLNDWYQHIDVKPTRIYNLHEGFDGKVVGCEGRFVNWRFEYEKSGVEVISLLNDLGFSRERAYNIKRALEIGANDTILTSSISYMIMDAICEGYKEIHIYGCLLSGDGEYSNQIYGVVKACRIAESFGVIVYSPDRSNWENYFKSLNGSVYKGYYGFTKTNVDDNIVNKLNNLVNK